MIPRPVEGIHLVGVIRRGREICIGIAEYIFGDGIHQSAISVDAISPYTSIIAGGRPVQVDLCATRRARRHVRGGAGRGYLRPSYKAVIDHIKGLPEGIDRCDGHIRTAHRYFQEVIDLIDAGGYRRASAGTTAARELNGIGIEHSTGSQRSECCTASTGDVVKDPVSAGEIPFVDMGV